MRTVNEFEFDTPKKREIRLVPGGSGKTVIAARLKAPTLVFTTRSNSNVSSKILLVLLFMVKKEVFEWIRTGQKNIELRRGKAKKGDVAVFQCGRNLRAMPIYRLGTL